VLAPNTGMMAQPSDDDINTVIDIIGVSDRGLVRSALQAKNNSIEAVMNDYFDSPESVSLQAHHFPRRSGTDRDTVQEQVWRWLGRDGIFLGPRRR